MMQSKFTFEVFERYQFLLHRAHRVSAQDPCELKIEIKSKTLNSQFDDILVKQVPGNRDTGSCHCRYKWVQASRLLPWKARRWTFVVERPATSEHCCYQTIVVSSWSRSLSFCLCWRTICSWGFHHRSRGRGSGTTWTSADVRPRGCSPALDRPATRTAAACPCPGKKNQSLKLYFVLFDLYFEWFIWYDIQSIYE